MGKDATRVRRRERKNIASGVAHVNSSFNNTTITITDAQGNTIAWSSAGTMAFKGSRKSTPSPGKVAGRASGSGCDAALAGGGTIRGKPFWNFARGLIRDLERRMTIWPEGENS